MSKQKKKFTIELVPTPKDEWECYVRLVMPDGTVTFLDINGHDHDVDEFRPMHFGLEEQMAIVHRFLYRVKDAKVRIKMIDLNKLEFDR